MGVSRGSAPRNSKSASPIACGRSSNSETRPWRSTRRGERASPLRRPSPLSRRVGEGERAVSVDAVLPTGIARGDAVRLITEDAEVRGTVVNARTKGSKPVGESGDGTGGRLGPSAGTSTTGNTSTSGSNAATDSGVGGDVASEGVTGEVLTPVCAPTTTGGEGRLTVAVIRTDAAPLLAADRARVVVESRGIRHEYELISLLRRAGRRFRRLTVRAGGALDGVTLGEAAVRDTHDVAVLAVRTDGGWQLAPEGPTEIGAGDELYAVGSRDALGRFREAIA